MNKVVLMGRLTRDPDVRYSGNGENSMCVARFTLAVDRRRASADGQKEADFISCVAFRKTAEFCEKYLHQGTKVTLSGSIQTGSYLKDNQKIYTTDVVVDDIEFAESKAAAEGRPAANPQSPAQGGFNNQQGFNNNGDVGAGFLNIPEGVEDEGLPFN